MGTLKQVITEAHRRSLWQVLGVYLVASWVIWQVVGSLYEWIGLPEWVPGAALVLLLIGLPIVLATAFVQEGAPLGRDGEDSVDTGAADHLAGLETTADTVSGRQRATGEPASSAIPADPAGPEPDKGTGLRAASGGPVNGEPSGSRRRTLFTWPRAITGGVLAFAALGLAATGFMGMRALGIGPAATLISSGELSERDEIVLADFESLTGDTVLSRVVTEAFRADLAQSTALQLATANDVQFVLERMAQSDREILTSEIAREVATRGGMKAVIAGDIGQLGGRYVLSARVVGALDGEVLATFRETATDSTELVSTVDRLAKSVREKVGESLRSIRQSPYLMAITTPSLPALKKLVQAYDAANRGDEPRALTLLGEAIELDPEFSEAHRKRGAILFNRGRISEAIASLETALQRPDRLTDYERYHTRALLAEARGNRTEAIAEYQALLEMDSTDTRALNNLAVTYSLQGEWQRAAEVSARALEVLRAEPEPSVFGGTYFGAAAARWNLGQRDSARTVLDELERLSPDNAQLLMVRGGNAAAAADYDAALDYFRRARAEHPGNADVQSGSRSAEAVVLGARGQIAGAIDGLREVAERQLDDGELGPYVQARLRVALLQAGVLGDTASATRELAALRSAAPLDSLPDPPLADLAVAYAAVGQVDSARTMADRLRARPVWFQRNYPYLLPAAEAAIADAEGDHGAAADAWRRANAEHAACDLCFLPRLGLAEERQGNRSAAIDAYTDYLETEYQWRVGWTRLGWMPGFEGDVYFRGFTLERLGDLHEQAGNRAESTRYYREFIDLWENADPALQPRVDAARRALQRLAAEGA